MAVPRRTARPGQSAGYEWRAAVIVAVALAIVAIALTAENASALASGSRPGASAITLIAAAVPLAVLTPLAYAKRRLGRQMGSRALQGDGTLSGIGAATSLLALAALALNDTLGWWWADRIAALIVAAIAAARAWRTAPGRTRTLRARSVISTVPAPAAAGQQPAAGCARR